MNICTFARALTEFLGERAADEDALVVQQRYDRHVGEKGSWHRQNNRQYPNKAGY